MFGELFEFRAAFQLDDDLIITVSKRRNNRNLKLSMTPAGKVRVTVPSWAPYSAGLAFAQSKIGWIKQNRSVPDLLIDGQQIGKANRLNFVIDPRSVKPSSRINGSIITVKYPSNSVPSSEEVQKLAKKASIRALRHQAESLLPQRLATLALKFNYTYKSVQVRQLKGRWGSCDQDKVITLNLFLMQLPWDHIDYVLLHELAHTRILKHGPDFWQEMSKTLSNPKNYRKQLHGHQPVLK